MANNDKNRKFEYMAWDQKFLQQGTHLNMKNTELFLRTMLSQDKDLLQPWHEEFTCSFCPVLIGDAGCGKSTLVKSIARDLEYEIRRMMMGDSMEEDNGGYTQGEKDKDGNHVFTLPKWMPVTPPKGKGGIAFIDEAGTGSPTHQNVIATLLTDGYDNGFYGHVVQKGWYFVAATNPDEIQYLLNQQLDQRVRDRMFPIWMHPESSEVLYHLSKYNKIPELIKGFLLMHDSHINVVSARKWEMVGRYTERWQAAKMYDSKTFLNTLSWSLPPGTVAALGKYIERGDDVDAYPMSAKTIMSADSKAHSTHCNRMKKWAKKAYESLVAATAFDIQLCLSDSSMEYSDEELSNLMDILKLIPKADLGAAVLDAAADNNSELHRRIADQFSSDDKLVQRLAKAQKRYIDNTRRRSA